MNPTTIEELASEIDKQGLWTGAIRGRERKDGKIELCFGHRRLAAIKKLKWKTVEVEILPLTDQDMITQGLIENLQREGLTDLERGDGILLLKKNLEESTGVRSTQAKLSELIGLPQSTIQSYIQVAQLTGSERKAVESKDITGQTALAAKAFGGSEMVVAAAKAQMTGKELREIVEAVEGKKTKPGPKSKAAKAATTKIQSELKKQIIQGKLSTAKEVK